MKKIFLALFCLLLVGLANAQAEEIIYEVRKGETLSGISFERGLDWREVAKYNHLKNPNLLRIGQKLRLQLPEGKEELRKSPWRNKGADRALPEGFSLKDSLTKARVLSMIEGFQKMTPAMKEYFVGQVASEKPQNATLAIGEEREEMHFGTHLKHNGIVVKQDPRTPAQKEWSVLRWTGDFAGKTVALDIPECGNVSWGYLKSPASVPVFGEVSKKVPQGTVEVSVQKPRGALPSFGDIPKKEESDRFSLKGIDVVTGIDTYRDSLTNPDHSGWVAWAKARWRGWEFENKGDRYGVGLMSQIAFGAGDDRGWDYDWYEVIFGGTVKGFMSEGWDFDLDLGLGYGSNEGGKGLVRSEQDYLFAYLGAHANIHKPYGDQDNWFSKLELDAQVKYQLSSDHHVFWNNQEVDGEAWDNSVIEFTAKQRIYDFWLNDKLKVSPEWLLTVGQNYGHDETFFRTGPSATFSLYNQDVATVHLFHYQAWIDGGGVQWHPLALTVDVEASIKAYKMSQIEEATEADIQARLKT